MKIIVVSDSHGRDDRLQSILKIHKSADAFVHCGDIECEPGEFPEYITVRGNNDIFFNYPDERIITAGDHKIYITHSHRFMYSSRLQQLSERAKDKGCDIVLFGHTHVALDETVNGVRLINPGSLWRSRDGREPSYAILTVEKDRVDVSFIFLKRDKNGWFL